MFLAMAYAPLTCSEHHQQEISQTSESWRSTAAQSKVLHKEVNATTPQYPLDHRQTAKQMQGPKSLETHRYLFQNCTCHHYNTSLVLSKREAPGDQESVLIEWRKPGSQVLRTRLDSACNNLIPRLIFNVVLWEIPSVPIERLCERFHGYTYSQMCLTTDSGSDRPHDICQLSWLPIGFDCCRLRYQLELVFGGSRKSRENLVACSDTRNARYPGLADAKSGNQE